MKIIKYEDKIDVNESTLPDKNKVTASDLNEIKNVINNEVKFYAGQILYFTNEIDFLLTDIRRTLQKGVDYEYIPADLYFRTGLDNPTVIPADDPVISGSDYLQESHLPEIHKLLMASLTPSTPVIGNTDVTSQPRNQLYLPLSANTGFSPGTYYIKLNETGRLEKLDPKYCKVFAIRFKRNITRLMLDTDNI